MLSFESQVLGSACSRPHWELTVTCWDWPLPVTVSVASEGGHLLLVTWIVTLCPDPSVPDDCDTVTWREELVTDQVTVPPCAVRVRVP